MINIDDDQWLTDILKFKLVQLKSYRKRDFIQALIRWAKIQCVVHLHFRYEHLIPNSSNLIFWYFLKLSNNIKFHLKWVSVLYSIILVHVHCRPLNLIDFISAILIGIKMWHMVMLLCLNTSFYFTLTLLSKDETFISILYIQKNKNKKYMHKLA